MRIGKLQISDTLVNKYPLNLLPVMSKFVPTHIESRPQLRDYLYTGYSDEFEDVDLKEGEDTPLYECVVKDEDKNVTVTFKKLTMSKKVKLSKEEIEALRLKKLEMSGKLVKK